MERSANDWVTKIRQFNQTYKRLLKGDVKYRFVIDNGLVEHSSFGLSMISRFRVSAILPRRLDEFGLSLPAVLGQANLPIGLFNQEKILVTTEELFALYRGIAEVSRDPAIGLKLGSEQRLERYSPVAIAALYTRSFRDAIQRLARYKQLTCPEEIRVTCQGSQSHYDSNGC